MAREHVSFATAAPDAAYPVHVEPALLQQCGAVLRGLSRSTKAAVITDESVAPLYADTVENSLRAHGFSPIRAVLPSGEEHKTLRDLEPVFDVVLAAGIDRSTPVIGLGGGVVTDMAGFAAASILRGVPLVQMPTTLLSMVDASVGGKTGVNHAVGKNLIGAFHQPLAVLIDPAVLKTLPPRELRSGLAECIKHEIIRDAAGFDRLEKNIARALSLDLEYLTELIAHNVAIKARVVEADPFEKAERAHLNFGHTIGHAIETVSRYDYAHGECVALGMVSAARLAVSLNILDDASARRIIALIAKSQLPTGGMKLDANAVVDAMAFDKKVKFGKLRFVLPDRIGHVIIRDDVPMDRVHRAVESLLE